MQLNIKNIGIAFGFILLVVGSSARVGYLVGFGVSSQEANDLGASTQFGMPGRYYNSPSAITDGDGAALLTDSQGRLVGSPSSTISVQ